MIEILILILLNNISIIITAFAVSYIIEKHKTPIQIVKEIKSKKEYKQKLTQDEINKNLANIENYDGTSFGQQEFKEE